MLLRRPLRRQGFYANRIKSIFGSSLMIYLPSWEAVGPTAYDQSGNNQNGTYSSVTLGQPGIGDGKTCPLFDGINDAVVIPHIWSLTEGTYMHWCKVPSVDVWNDNTDRGAFIWSNGMGEYGGFMKTMNGLFRYIMYADYDPGDTLEWFHVATTYSAAANQIIGYFNGVAVGAPQPFTTFTTHGDGYIGTFWAGQPCWSGWIAHWLVLDRVATPAEIAQAARV